MVITHVDYSVGHSVALVFSLCLVLHLLIWFFDQVLRVYPNPFTCSSGFLMHFQSGLVYEYLLTKPACLIGSYFEHLREDIASTAFIYVRCTISRLFSTFLIP